MKLELSRQFSENTQISNLMKIREVAAELFHTDGRTDITELTVTSQFLQTRLNTSHKHSAHTVSMKPSPQNYNT